MAAKFVLKKGSTGKFSFSLAATNFVWRARPAVVSTMGTRWSLRPRPPAACRLHWLFVWVWPCGLCADQGIEVMGCAGTTGVRLYGRGQRRACVVGWPQPPAAAVGAEEVTTITRRGPTAGHQTPGGAPGRRRRRLIAPHPGRRGLAGAGQASRREFRLLLA